MVSAKVDKQEYLLIDTPGFNDTWRAKRPDATILGEIAQALTLQTQLGVKLVGLLRFNEPARWLLTTMQRGILYLYDISLNRMTGETLRQFELIKRICGERNYQNVLLVTTHWPSRVEEQPKCTVREGELRREFWKDMISRGSTMCRFDDRHSSAKAIVRRLAAKNDITLTLQDELATGNGLKKTSAFSFIVNARSKDEEKLAKKSDEVEPESVQIRKEAETKLNDDIVGKIQNAIEEEEATARKRQKKLTVRQVFGWILGLTHLSMGGTQLGLAM